MSTVEESKSASTNGSSHGTAQASVTSMAADRVAAQMVKKNRRKPLLFILLAVVIIGAGIATFLSIHVSHFQETDDAYIEGHVITMSPQVSALVKTVMIQDNQVVHKGDVLVQLDPADYQVALDQAKANQAAMDGKLQQARSEIEEARANVDQYKAAVDVAQANFENAASDFKRFSDLAGQNAGAVSKQQMDSANAAERSNNATVKQAQASLASAEAQIATKQATAIAAEGDLKKAIADVHKAEVNLGYCTITAPSDGKITRKSVEEGSYVQTGEQLFALVPAQVWVVANFKETQLEKMKVGQPVSISVDAYPGEDLHGHVDSIQSGTGARFSMLPAENATGNFVKVVQRIPVKILVDNAGLALSPGMSVVAEVDVR
jgi:membrane fusion protein (multidrug efflux system)